MTFGCLMLSIAVAPQEQTTATNQPVAVCLIGRLSGLERVAERLAVNLLLPLQADVFAYTTVASVRSASVRDGQHLLALPGLVEVVVEQEDVTKMLHKAMRKAHGDKWRLALRLTERVNGYWLGGLLQSDGAKRSSTGLLQIYALHRCLGMIERSEQVGGSSYDWIVKSRFDFFWEMPHMPMSQFSKDAIWIPAGMDCFGLNDRHALVPRSSILPKASHAYFNAWEWVVKGAAAMVLDHFLKRSRAGDSRFPLLREDMNTEQFLKVRLASFNIPVLRYASIAWVLRSGNKSGALRTHSGDFGCCNFEYMVAMGMSRCLREAISKHEVPSADEKYVSPLGWQMACKRCVHSFRCEVASALILRSCGMRGCRYHGNFRNQSLSGLPFPRTRHDGGC